VSQSAHDKPTAVDITNRSAIAKLVGAFNGLRTVAPDPPACPIPGPAVVLDFTTAAGGVSRATWNACGVVVRGVPLLSSGALTRLMTWLLHHPRG
jgi:hypothetical protein